MKKGSRCKIPFLFTAGSFFKIMMNDFNLVTVLNARGFFMPDQGLFNLGLIDAFKGLAQQIRRGNGCQHSH